MFSKQFNGALETLRKILQRDKVVSAVYQIASEAYVGLKMYDKAEIAALTALHLGVKNIGLMINLANFTAMRGDYIMSKKWLEAGNQIDPNDENLKKCQMLLFPNNAPRDSNNPF